MTVMDEGSTHDAWAPLAERFVDQHYGSLRGRVRTYVIHEHLCAHLGPAPQRVVDVGGGAGNQSLPLARAGHVVTIVDPSAAMLERATERLADEDDGTAARVRLVHAVGEDAPRVLGGDTFDAVLCHGVLMYLDDPGPLVDALCELTAPGGVVSVVAKNAEVMALRPALGVTGPRRSPRSTATGRSTASVSTRGRHRRAPLGPHRPFAVSSRWPGTACVSSPTAGHPTDRPRTPRTWCSRPSSSRATEIPTDGSAACSTCSASGRPDLHTVQMPEPGRLVTVVLEVGDLDRAVALYRDGFGLTSTSPITRAGTTAQTIAGSAAGTRRSPGPKGRSCTSRSTRPRA